ncbi:MAG: DNA mismatch repair protein MutL [Desulfobacterales bacterium RIFOXYA12_FULL_46_15]|nr:MAG: DNA mismatch repair protein MutL [Desulfobacterales bacterium RIFOXYA12_FULL_46_15]
MTTVRILPEILSNQIAAGEVVERPSSVVKELVENSIDAKASAITIEVEKSGKSLIRVSDDGIGLSRDDALLSIERYATSKIFTKEDLFSISTMGFRGEALPSIASVSKLTMVTRPKDRDTGTRIEIFGGKVRSVSDIGAPVGTLVEVKDLFFNTPARKKFLKSDTTEISHISDGIAGIALGNPDIRFRFFSNKSLQKNFPLSDSLFQRTVNVLGTEVSGKMNEISHSEDGLAISGYCVLPDIVRNSASKIFLFVNRRLVYDRGLISAIFQGYRGRLMKGRYPLLVLFIDIAFDQVDVNVHPTKREVRFFNHQRVYGAVSGAIGKSFSIPQKDISGDSPLKFSQSSVPPAFHPDRPVLIRENDSPGVEQSVMTWGKPADMPVYKKPDRAGTRMPELPKEKPHTPVMFYSDPPRIIGQVMGTYILAESGSGLLLIDQHAAHERIVYEALKKKLKISNMAGQSLLIPETVELTHRESDILLSLIPDLSILGIEVEPFGGTTFVIKSIPSIISGKEMKPILTKIIEKTLTEKDESSKDGWLDECLILMACHRAVRANSRMNAAEMQNLLKDLETCDNPMHCPHGRPIMVTMSKNDLEKLFKRIV